MEKKKRKYEILSSVQVPDIEEIQKAASDYSEVSSLDVADNTVKKMGRFPIVDTKPQFDTELNSIKKEMQKLAVAVAKEEKENEIDTESDEESAIALTEDSPAVFEIPEPDADKHKAKAKNKKNTTQKK